MRPFLFFLLFLFLIPFNQLEAQNNTYVPDDNFENYLETNGMGDGIALNDSVYTSAIDTVTSLDVSNKLIQTIEGIQDFTDLIIFKCENNLLTSLSLTYNISFTTLVVLAIIWASAIASSIPLALGKYSLDNLTDSV